jgi:hypothetical protein
MDVMGMCPIMSVRTSRVGGEKTGENLLSPFYPPILKSPLDPHVCLERPKEASFHNILCTLGVVATKKDNQTYTSCPPVVNFYVV